MAKMEIEKKKCTTPEFRASFPQVFEPKSFQDQPAKYSIVMLFAKTTDLKELKRAVFNAATEKWGAKEKWPKGLRMPFRDGNEKADMTGYKDTIFVSASSKERPGVVDQKRAPIVADDNVFYAGCFGRATLIAFAYDKAGNRGVSFSLQNIQKVKDGQPFSGRKAAADEFTDIEEDSDNADNYSDTEYDLGF